MRGADFPRFQLAVVGVGLQAATTLALEFERLPPRIMAAAALACIAYQAWWILPFTPLWRREVKQAAASGALPRLRIISCNVLTSNRRSRDLLKLSTPNAPTC